MGQVSKISGSSSQDTPERPDWRISVYITIRRVCARPHAFYTIWVFVIFQEVYKFNFKIQINLNFSSVNLRVFGLKPKNPILGKSIKSSLSPNSSISRVTRTCTRLVF